ncbi:MAG: enoyl-CoA hydratase [Rhodospirillaceae bacterium]|nr:enoyl-CoA hydratase [Rhodospirillaceae bacterium]
MDDRPTPPASPPPASQTADRLVLREDRGPAAWLTLNRPQARNALSMALMEALIDAIDEVAADDAVRAVVIAGAGPAFCAGHDLKELRATPTRQFYEAVFECCSALMLRIVSLKKPVIARVHGIATAAGCQLVATCDLAVAASDARFATPGVNIGLFCSTPMVALSRNVGRKPAMEMLLTGEMIDAATAQSLGLINRAVAPDQVDATVAGFVDTIAAKSPLTLAIGKDAFYNQLELGITDAYAYASSVMTTNMLARDAEEGIDAFIEKRKPNWKGC